MIRLRTDDARFTPALSDAELLGHLVWAGAGYLVTDVWVSGAQVVEHGECTTVDVTGRGPRWASVPADWQVRREQSLLSWLSRGAGEGERCGSTQVVKIRDAGGNTVTTPTRARSL